MAAVLSARRIGRFDIVSTLGRGAQGTVYLAHDTHLDRRVALKTLRVDRMEESARQAQTGLMLSEARIVGKLAHPNLVALFDAGEENGMPYLVFEYVEGQTLADLIRTRRTIAPLEAARLTISLLAGIEYAHTAGVFHRDIKPANIMITRDGVPRLMDFGIASRAGGASTGEQSLSGTPGYMAPEYLGGGAFTPACDLFALGMVLYEMLTGAPAIQAGSAYQTMFAMTNEAFPRPSTRNPAIDERLEAIVMQALEKHPAARFAGASAMTAALAGYANPQPAAAQSAGAGAQGTLEFVLRRMRYKSDFPVLASTISSVNNMANSEHEPTSALADNILKDVSLTNKLLRMVNTAYFQQFGGSVSTVSRAVSILGYQKVRNAALSLMLFDHLQNKAQAAELKDQVTASYFSGVLSSELVAGLGIRDAEEAFICAMFHRLGRLLATFYLHEESGEIARIAAARGIEEDAAAVEVIGISYADLGLGVARQWNFPESIVASMRPVAPRGAPAAAGRASEGSRMHALSDLSNRLAAAVSMPPGRAREALMKRLEAQYGKAFELADGQLEKILGTAARAFTEEARALGLATGTGPFVAGLHALAAATGDEAAGAQGQGASAAAIAETLLDTVPTEVALQDAPASADQRQNMLTAGIADITSTLAGEYQLNDVLRIILETMFRAIGFTRVLLCTRDPQTHSLRARLGMGAGAEAIIQRGFSVPLEASRDVFHAAISKAVDICIEDRDAEKIRAYVPDWYRNRVSARGFVLFPVVINNKAVALIYADGDAPGMMRFANGELNLLKTLRNQAILAIRQKSAG